MKSGVKVYGEMRTGTNYLVALIASNYPNISIYRSGFGWKHGAPRVDVIKNWYNKNGVPLKLILITKDPFSWVWSIISGALRGILSKQHILKDKKNKLKDLDLLTDKRVHKSLVDRWNKRNRVWLETIEKFNLDTGKYKLITGVHIPYVSLIRNAKQVLKSNLGKFKKPFANISKVVNPGNIVSGQSFNKDYYIKRRFMNSLPKDLIRYIKKHIDRDLVIKLGYGNIL